MATWRSSLAEAIALGSEHLACYEVIYEEDTPLFAQLRAGKIPPDEDLACAMYGRTPGGGGRGWLAAIRSGQLRAAGRRRGELPERACRHNVNYWRGGSFHGLGP